MFLEERSLSDICIFSAIEAPKPYILVLLEDYVDIISPTEMSTLPLNRVTNYIINIVDSKEPPYSPLYVLLERKL